MKNLEPIKDADFKKFVTAYNKARKDAGGKELSEAQIDKLKKRMTGNNGRVVGSTYTLTGKVDFAYPIIGNDGKVTSTYEAVETEEGDWISITQLMGITSLNGYVTKGDVEHVSRAKASKDSEAVSNPVHCEVVDNFSFDDVWEPPTRNKLMFLAMLHSNPNYFKGVHARFLGIAAKPTHAKKNSDGSFSEQYIAGDARAIVQKLWSLTD